MSGIIIERAIHKNIKKELEINIHFMFSDIFAEADEIQRFSAKRIINNSLRKNHYN